MKDKVTLQINLAPVDYSHARHLLHHQLRALGNQVDEILLTIDTRPSKGRFSDGWVKNAPLLEDFLTNEILPNYNAAVLYVDYSKQIKSEVSRYFFGGDNIPDKDFRGGPFYAYFYGLYKASNNLVFHLDSDMFIGGGSINWIHEAVQMFNSNQSYFIAGPLPGPPNPSDILVNQPLATKIAPYTWQMDNMSSRIFMIDKQRFSLKKLTLTRPSLRGQITALIAGNTNADLPEHIISDYMHQNQLKRVDFMGSGKGMWSLHPPYRTEDFYHELPQLVIRVESNDLPAKQQGFYDIIDDVCDWTPAREKINNNRWWKRNPF